MVPGFGRGPLAGGFWLETAQARARDAACSPARDAAPGAARLCLALRVTGGERAPHLVHGWVVGGDYVSGRNWQGATTETGPS